MKRVTVWCDFLCFLAINMVFVGKITSRHLLSKEGDHLGEVHWSVDLVKHSLGGGNA